MHLVMVRSILPVRAFYELLCACSRVLVLPLALTVMIDLDISI
jgi:hypothetical protein